MKNKVDVAVVAALLVQLRVTEENPALELPAYPEFRQGQEVVRNLPVQMAQNRPVSELPAQTEWELHHAL